MEDGPDPAEKRWLLRHHPPAPNHQKHYCKDNRLAQMAGGADDILFGIDVLIFRYETAN